MTMERPWNMNFLSLLTELRDISSNHKPHPSLSTGEYTFKGTKGNGSPLGPSIVRLSQSGFSTSVYGSFSVSSFKKMSLKFLIRKGWVGGSSKY